MRYENSIGVLAAVCVSLLLVACGNSSSKEEVLQERVGALKSELESTQIQLGQANQKLGEIQGNRDQLSRDMKKTESELTDLRSQLKDAERLRLADKEQKNTVSKYLEQRENLYSQLNDMKEKLVEAKAQRHEIDRLANELKDAKENSELKITKLSKQLNELNASLNEAESKSNEAIQLQGELAAARKTIKDITADRPEFFIPLLQKHGELGDNDLQSWGVITLQLTSSRLALGQEMQLTLPLSMIDFRGSFVLTFGSLNATAESCDLNMKDRIATLTFPNAAEFHSAIEISTTDILSVSFGPSDFQSKIVFAVNTPENGWLSNQIDFKVKEVRLSGLPVATRSDQGKWTLQPIDK